MKKIAAILLLSSAATPVLAADIIEYIPPPPAPIIVAASSWSGLYLGGQAGYAFHGDGSGGVPGAFIRIPGTPGTPGTPANPGSPEVPPTPGSPEIVVPAGVVEFSFACAGVPAGGACSGAIITNGVPNFVELTQAEISAAFAAVGGDPDDLLAVAGAIAGEVQTGATVIPAVPATPGSPAVPATPEIPATPGTPEEVTSVDSIPGVSRFEDDDDGFIGGVHIGYDQQLGYSLGSGALVVGAVADLSYVDIERYGGLSGFGEEISLREELDYLATLRLRVGAGFERVLVYATGGLAFGEVETTFVNTVFDDFDSESDTRVGYAVGGGVDFLVAPNLSLGVEYLYTDLGDGDGNSRSYDVGGAFLDVDADEDFDFHTVWAKASFRFN